MGHLLNRLKTRPGTRDWLELCALAAIFTALALPFGLATGAITLEINPSAERVLIFALYALLIPAFFEEAVFRGILLPGWRGGKGLAGAVFAVAAYVAWHPLAAWAFLPAARPLYYDPAFLAIVTALGCILTISTLRSGSLWSAMAFHWLVVVTWKAFLGGAIYLM